VRPAFAAICNPEQTTPTSHYRSCPSAEELLEYGGTLKDLVTYCDVNGVECTDEEWEAVVPGGTDWGKCWTLTPSAANSKAKGVGVDNAINLELNLQEDYFCAALSESVGLQLSVHERNTWPNPNTGITLSPAANWNLGMQTLKTVNLPWPYSDCDVDAKK
jgi:hypothetical protein